LQDLNDLHYFAQVVRHGGFHVTWCDLPNVGQNGSTALIAEIIGLTMSLGNPSSRKQFCRALKSVH
jgi:hypothetical protein